MLVNPALFPRRGRAAPHAACSRHPAPGPGRAPRGCPAPRLRTQHGRQAQAGSPAPALSPPPGSCTQRGQELKFTLCVFYIYNYIYIYGIGGRDCSQVLGFVWDEGCGVWRPSHPDRQGTLWENRLGGKRWKTLGRSLLSREKSLSQTECFCPNCFGLAEDGGCPVRGWNAAQPAASHAWGAFNVGAL